MGIPVTAMRCQIGSESASTTSLAAGRKRQNSSTAGTRLAVLRTALIQRDLEGSGSCTKVRSLNSRATATSGRTA